VYDKRQFECFLCNEMEQKMYRERFLKVNFLVLDTIPPKSGITRTDENLPLKTIRSNGFYLQTQNLQSEN
jgi:hypothetical protein